MFLYVFSHMCGIFLSTEDAYRSNVPWSLRRSISRRRGLTVKKSEISILFKRFCQILLLYQSNMVSLFCNFRHQIYVVCGQSKTNIPHHSMHHRCRCSHCFFCYCSMCGYTCGYLSANSPIYLFARPPLPLLPVVRIHAVGPRA